jgi:hypothetical protein
MNNNFASYQAGAETSQFQNPTQQGAPVHVRDTIQKVSTVNGVVTETTQGHEKGSTAQHQGRTCVRRREGPGRSRLHLRTHRSP